MNSADVQDSVANEVNDRLSKATQELANKYAQGGQAFVTYSYQIKNELNCISLLSFLVYDFVYFRERRY